MLSHARPDLQPQLDALDVPGPERVGRLVDLILADAVRCAASDVHLEPTHSALTVRYRLDGVVHAVASLRRDLAPNVVARLKVLAELLTYRLDIPQEGRIANALGRLGVDMRVSTFPTIHGEKVVVRLFDPSGRTLDLEQLGLSSQLQGSLRAMLREPAGAILLTGPSGSGKTTTLYACLRSVAASSEGGRHIVTIEDPVEQVLEGVSQSQARPGTEFDFARGLRSLLRQDPEVIMVGEVRDPDTAAVAVEAALTGHLVLSTVHSGSACGVIGRLLDMGVEPYLLTSALKGVLNQRLVRRLCPACRRPPGASGQTSGWEAAGCARCAGTGYQGRLLLAELLTPTVRLRQAILARSDTSALEAAAGQERSTMWEAAQRAVEDGGRPRGTRSTAYSDRGVRSNHECRRPDHAQRGNCRHGPRRSAPGSGAGGPGPRDGQGPDAPRDRGDRRRLAGRPTLARGHSTPGRPRSPLLRRPDRAGVRSGRISEVLTTLTVYARSLADLRATVANAIFYPAVVLAFACFLFTFLFLFVIPQFDQVFRDFGMQLPLTTELAFTIGRHPLELVVLPIGAVVGGFLLVRLIMRSTEKGRLAWARFVYTLPVVGALVRATRLAAFSDLLAILVDHSMPLPEAFRLAGLASSDPLLADAARHVEQDLGQGQSLGESLRTRRLVPELIAWMTGLGEKRATWARPCIRSPRFTGGRRNCGPPCYAACCRPF